MGLTLLISWLKQAMLLTNNMEIKERKLARIEVNKSKFISILIPLENIDDFKPLLENIKKEFPKAKHYVYAYRVGTASKSSDDREPKGTAGRPLLELLHKKDINNAALVVVRYYGGTNLGASRLLRTYVSSGVEVIKLFE